MRPFLFSLLILAGCTVPDKASLKVSRETKNLRKSPVVLRAENSGEETNDKLELRKNNSFFYESNLRGTQKVVIYSGTFTKVKDTLILDFHNNHKDSMWTGKAVVTDSEITLLSKNPSFNKEMIITNVKLKFPTE